MSEELLDEIAAGARRVLDENWLGASTLPSRTLYPAPVELGLGVHRDRPLVVRRGTRPAGAPVAVPGAVGRRARAAHRVQPVGRRGRVLPGAGVLAVVQALAGRAARRRDLGDHPAADPRPGRARDAPPRADVDGSTASCAAVPAASSPRTATSRIDAGRWQRAAGVHAPLGVRPRQLAGLGPRPRGDGHPGRRRPAVRAPRPGPREPGRPPDERGLRPVRVPRGAVPRLAATTTASCSTRCRSSSPARCSTRSTCGRPMPWRRSPRSSGRTRGRTARPRSRSTRRCSTELWDPDTKRFCCARRRAQRARRREHDRVVRAAARPGPAEGPARRARGGPRLGELPPGQARRLRRAELRPARRGLRRAAVLARPRLDQHELAAVVGPAAARPGTQPPRRS